MSVIVMGMEMPADWTEYRVVEDSAGRKFLVEDDRLFERCFLLRPLPEKHGRLKDVDAIIEDIRKNSESYFADDFAHEWIDRQPTIVEPEGE